jgi:hypothetical protein
MIKRICAAFFGGALDDWRYDAPISKGGSMHIILAAFLLLFAASPAFAQDPVPVGQLPQGARPTAYRLDLTIDPSRERFSGHAASM